MVFLLLVALYESWAIAGAVMLIVPVGALGSVLAVHALGMPNDVYFKVGLITIIGLAAKNAILIVEFAKALREKGMPLVEAAMEVARLRFRPIVMTSMALHSRRRSACHRDRSWRGQPARHRHRRDRRHADGHYARRGICPGVLCLGALALEALSRSRRIHARGRGPHREHAMTQLAMSIRSIPLPRGARASV